MFPSYLVELGNVEKLGELVEVKHRLVPTVLTKEGDILAQIHVLKVICDKASITTLYALSKVLKDLAVFC